MANKRKKMDLRSSIKKAENLRDINCGILRHQKRAMNHVLAQQPQFAEIVEKVKSCTSRHPCNSQWCPTCSNPKSSNLSRRLLPNESLNSSTCNQTYIARSGDPKNYRLRGGKRMAEPFIGLPLAMLHCVTINLALCPIDGNLKETLPLYRHRLRRLLKRFNSGAIARGKFDIAIKVYGDLNFEITDAEYLDEFLDSTSPYTRIAMLHIHFVLFAPNLSRKEVRNKIIAEFPGKSRVRVDSARSDIKHDSGIITSGVQGFLEYASLEKVECKFGVDAIDAVIDFATISATWNRRNRNFSYGKASETKSLSYDPIRLRELEAERAQHQIKKQWSKMNFAERDIHTGMSNFEDVLLQVRNGRVGNHLIHHLNCAQSYLLYITYIVCTYITYFVCNSPLSTGALFPYYIGLFWACLSDLCGKPRCRSPPTFLLLC
jgi:hypothetical protein